MASRATASRASSQEKLDDIEKASTAVGSPQTSPLEHDSIFKPEADLGKLPGHGKPRRESESTKFGGEEENPNVNVSFHRPSTPSTVHKLKGSTYQNVGESGIKRMHKFSLYEMTLCTTGERCTSFWIL